MDNLNPEITRLYKNAEEVRRRLAQCTWRAPLWLTRAPTFAEKALLFPGVVFVVGMTVLELK